MVIPSFSSKKARLDIRRHFYFGVICRSVWLDLAVLTYDNLSNQAITKLNDPAPKTDMSLSKDSSVLYIPFRIRILSDKFAPSRLSGVLESMV